MAGWHHRLDGHEFEQASGDSEGQGSLACSACGRKEFDMTEQLNSNMGIRAKNKPSLTPLRNQRSQFKKNLV